MSAVHMEPDATPLADRADRLDVVEGAGRADRAPPERRDRLLLVAVEPAVATTAITRVPLLASSPSVASSASVSMR